MTAFLGFDPFELADQLRAFTQRDLVTSFNGDAVTKFRPSLRGIAKQMTGISHQRLSDFLRNPGKSTPEMRGRIAGVINAPQFFQQSPGRVVTYVDAAVFTEDVFSKINMEGVTAFRIISGTDEVGYNGYRSTGWTADTSRLDELLNAAPGGRNNVIRVVLDKG